jgi:hypothetical protein
LGSTIPTALAYDQPVTTYTNTGSARSQYTSEAGYKSATIGYFGAVWIPGRNVYELNYRISGLGEARDKTAGFPMNALSTQKVTIAESYNKAHQAIWTSTDTRYIGAWPNGGSTANYDSVGYAIISLAVGAINGYAGFALSVADLINSMRSASDVNQNGETVIRQWNYFPYKSDLAHWFWWIYDVDPSQQVKFTVKDEASGTGFGTIALNWEFTVNTPSAPSKMSSEERAKYGIEVIPINDLKSRATELNVAPETVIELQKRGEPVYYVHNLPITVVDSTSIIGLTPNDQQQMVNSTGSNE